MQAIFSSLTQFLWYFACKHLLKLIGLMTIGVLWAVHFCLSPIFVKEIIDGIAATPQGGIGPVLWPFIGYLGMTLLLLVVNTWYDYLGMKTFPAIRAEVIETLQSRLFSYPYPFFHRHLSGSIANKISDLSKGAITIITSCIDDFFSRSLLFLLGVATLFMVHPLFGTALVTWAILFFALSYFLSKKSQVLSALFSEARSTAMGKVVDSLTNIFNIKIFGTSRYEQSYIRKHLLIMKAEEQKVGSYFLRLKLLQGISTTALMILITTLLFYTHQKGWVTLGDFALVLSLATGIVDQTFYLALQLVEWTEDIGVAKQALSIFSESIQEEKNQLPALKVTQGEIAFEHVVFFYTPFKPVFKDLSFQIARGEKVGVVGLSGSGKSTLAHLLLRLYDVTGGKILIDGQNIIDYSKESLTIQIGMIPQEPYLFHRSIYENILYGKLNATKEEVIQASQKARCHEFVTALPEGYETVVGERGIKLSGGQRQRIAIARAFLKDAPILILDEATSALDSITEKEIQESLVSLMKGRTVIVIAHRLSTLALMDRILVFEHGTLLEQGSHEELLKHRSRYSELWTIQSNL